MKLSKREVRDHCYRGIVLLGTVMTAIVTVLRVIFTPTLRDSHTGRFTVSIGIVAAQALTIVMMALLATRGGTHRVDVHRRRAVPLALSAMLVGIVLVVSGMVDVLQYVLNDEIPAPVAPVQSYLTVVILVLTMVLTVAAGITFIFFGLQIAREGGTRIGMRSWTVLLPVLWMWFRLARYEMSYASAISFDKSLYDFGMFVLEMLFLFKLARFASGIGKTRPASLIVYAMSTGMMAISGYVTRLCMYLLGDAHAQLASQLVGLPDLAVGVFAMVFGYCLYKERMERRRYASSSSGQSSPVSDMLLTSRRRDSHT